MPRLVIIDNPQIFCHQVCHIQYLKQSRGLTFQDGDPNSISEFSTQETVSNRGILAHPDRRTLGKNPIPIEDLRETLQKTASLLYRSKDDQVAIVHHLVDLPFTVFTDQSIKLGVSLWLGVINENPRLESIVLTEIAQCWEKTICNRMGFLSKDLL